mmetsp:Transcript_12952/g.27504  ORF Transcript_12952/g.27504 Transcript_12952/m.27504 type:complete len:217 (+) Transcript_12952:92-742(+)|eukprot:CAMPEP_0183729486 /NCGR_PEP_ID=MMETSP0737-20130205/30445_1 /TAXON_ID=385413 /ORGANISM="Thalassiosira miniscula, Strain CCMP1093" /LENGTH=216 /DNA_ID=CAMNT_0025961687 /DNA_START=7 /DNA_END=657 /DNA_ORIENTATION=-
MKTAIIIVYLWIATSASSYYPAYGYIQSRLNQSTLRKSVKFSRTPLAAIKADDENKESELGPTKVIKDAIEVTKKFGLASYKARMAWDIVEKIEYSFKNNSDEIEAKSDIADGGAGKLAKSLGSIDGASYDVVENSLRDLKSLIDEEMKKVKEMKDMANKIKVVKRGPKVKAMREDKSIEAITAAQEASREYGIHSTQTALAWEAFEEIVSNDLAP